MALQLPPHFFSSAALFLLPALALCAPSGYSYGAALLLVASLLGLRVWWRHALDADAWRLYGAFALTALCMLLDVWRSHPQGLALRAFDAPAKILCTLPCLWYLSRRAPQSIWLWMGLVTGALGAAAVGMFQWVTSAGRVGGFTNPIQYGDLAMMLGMMALCGWNVAARSPWVWRAWLLLGFAAGLLASVLSQSRGGWLALALMAALGGIFLMRRARFRMAATSMALLLLLCVALWQVPRLGVQARVAEAQREVQTYIAQKGTGEAANSSVGARLQMWDFAWQLYREKPLWGWSQRGYQEQVAAGVATQRLHPALGSFTHPHNEWLDVAAKRGSLGVLALLLLYAVPLLVFARYFSEPRASAALRGIAAAGMVLVLAYMGFGLTQAFFAHNSAVTVYFYFLSLLWGAAAGEQAGPERE